MKSITLVLLAVSSFNLFACMGARVELNDDTILTGSGVIYPISKENVDPRTFKDIGKSLNAGDSKGVVTHKVSILGYHADEGGVIFTSYLVKDLKDGSENVLKLNSNYHGDGHTSRSIQPPSEQTEQDSNFEILRNGGC